MNLNTPIRTLRIFFFWAKKYEKKTPENCELKKSEFFFSIFICFRTFLNYLDEKIKSALFEEEGGLQDR